MQNTSCWLSQKNPKMGCVEFRSLFFIHSTRSIRYLNSILFLLITVFCIVFYVCASFSERYFEVINTLRHVKKFTQGKFSCTNFAHYTHTARIRFHYFSNIYLVQYNELFSCIIRFGGRAINFTLKNQCFISF